MTSPKTVQIIGGGLAGLSLGIALRKAGVPVRIFLGERLSASSGLR